MNRPPRDIHQAIADRGDKDRDFAVATVLKAAGSTPCKAGAKAIIEPGGAILGTVGGGAVEARAQQLAAEALKTKRPLVFDFNLEGEAVEGVEPICGGMMHVLVDPLAAQRNPAHAAAANARRQRTSGLLLTIVRGDKEPEIETVFTAAAEIPGMITFPAPDALREVLASGEAKLFVKYQEDSNCRLSLRESCGFRGAKGDKPPEEERVEILVEPLVPNPLLVIAGGGHVGQALALQADLVGFDIFVIDDRAEFTDANLFPEGTTTRCGPIAEEIARLAAGNDTYIVIVTPAHRHDAEVLAACLKKPVAYIGMIGSRRKVEMMRKKFIESGKATAAEFDRAYAPIGLDIGSLSVPEIAASITAQLIAVRRNGTAPENSIEVIKI